MATSAQLNTIVVEAVTANAPSKANLNTMVVEVLVTKVSVKAHVNTMVVEVAIAEPYTPPVPTHTIDFQMLN